MSPARGKIGDALNVTIVSDNAETLDGLENYLQRAGVATRSTRDIVKASDLIGTSSAAAVIFPDDYRANVIPLALAKLHSDKPHALLVVVTRNPKTLEKSLKSQGVPALVVPKPAWGWSILDAIREHVAHARSDDGDAR